MGKYSNSLTLLLLSSQMLLSKLYTNWQSTGNGFEGAFGGYDDVSFEASLIRTFQLAWLGSLS